MLLKLRDYIQRKRVVSTQQLAREFCVDEQALEPMLAFWVRKGSIQRCQDSATCERCAGCTPNTIIYYQYDHL